MATDASAKSTASAPLGPETGLPAQRVDGLNDQSFRILIDCLPAGMLAYRGGIVVYANLAVCAYVGLSREQMVGRQVVELIETLFAPDERVAGHTRLQQTASGAVLPPVERRVRRADGHWGVAELTSLTVTIDGLATQLTIVHDLTDRRAMEAKVASADRMATLGRVAAGLAHELNNPLAHLLGSLELACERLPATQSMIDELRASSRAPSHSGDLEQLAETLVEIAAQLGAVGAFLSEAAQGARRVRGVMADFRALSMPSTAQPRPIDVRVALRSALRLSSHQLQDVATLTETLAAVPSVVADESRLCQAILYLFLDIASYLRQLRTSRQSISLIAVHRSGTVAIEIRGAPPARIDLLIASTSGRAPSVTPTTGVQVCSEIVRGYGGVLRPIADDGAFGIAVCLPAAQADGRVGQPLEDAPKALRGRLLVIDDDAFVAGILQRILGGEHEVLVETNPLAALRRLLAGDNFDVVLCDAMMPELGGLELFGRVKSQSPSTAQRFIFVTGGAFAANADELLAATTRPCLGKPFDIVKVRQLVREQVTSLRLGTAN